MIDPDGRHPWLIRLLQAAQRFANSPAGRAIQRNAGRAWNATRNFVRRDWQGFTQKVRNLPNRVRNDAVRVFNSAKNLFGRGINFNASSNVKGLNVGDLQRFNIGGEVKLGLKTAQEASKALSQGGAGMEGVKVQGSGKLIQLFDAGSGNIKVVVQKLVDGKVTDTFNTVGEASKLGIQNASELIKKGAGYFSHFVGEVK
jgi:hypothetical protein